jgi:hypothetical protein
VGHSVNNSLKTEWQKGLLVKISPMLGVIFQLIQWPEENQVFCWLENMQNY